MDMFKWFRKKTNAGFVVDESTQSFRLPGLNYLYDAPTDNLYPLYKQLYDNVPVLDCAISTYTDLISSGYTIIASDPGIITETNEILNGLEFDKRFKTMLDNYFVYGFYGAEIVPSAAFDSIEKLIDLPSEQLRLKRNDKGDIIKFVQTTASKEITFDPSKIIYAANRSSSEFPYGRSLFRSMPWVTKTMLEMQDAMSKIYKRYGSPRFHVQYTPGIQLDEPTLKKRLNDIKNKFNGLDVNKDFFTAGDVTITVVGSGGKEQFKLTIEMQEIMQSLFSGLKLPAGVLGYNYGSTETHLGKQIEILLGRLLSYQTEHASILNKKLMPMIALLYGFNEIPKINFDRPVIADEKIEVEIEETKIDNVIKLLDRELITKDKAKLLIGI